MNNARISKARKKIVNEAIELMDRNNSIISSDFHCDFFYLLLVLEFLGTPGPQDMEHNS